MLWHIFKWNVQAKIVDIKWKELSSINKQRAWYQYKVFSQKRTGTKIYNLYCFLRVKNLPYARFGVANKDPTEQSVSGKVWHLSIFCIKFCNSFKILALCKNRKIVKYSSLIYHEPPIMMNFKQYLGSSVETAMW
jgi:hypothetical protein